MANQPGEQDPFDQLLGLEDKFYDEGYQLGVADGSQAGHVQGRLLGLEKGFEKYMAMGQLHGRATIWGGRFQMLQTKSSRAISSEQERIAESNLPPKASAEDDRELGMDTLKENITGESSKTHTLLDLPDNSRLGKHIRVLYALTEPASLSTKNAEDSVSDFDDRLKRARAKVKVIGKLIGDSDISDEESTLGAGVASSRKVMGDGEGSIEDVSSLNVRH
jgi:hypothetical protein